jgi:hypothetical protein
MSRVTDFSVDLAGREATRDEAVSTASLARARAGAVAGAIVLLVVWVAIVAWAEPFSWAAAGSGHDARPYWSSFLAHPYDDSTLGAFGAYLYSPVFLQLIAPLRALSWVGFIGAWEAILIVATAVLTGPALLAPIGLALVPELLGGNITILLALAIVAGFRWPASWSFVLLTKVTPGIGLLWFAVRREWRSLGIALGATLAIVAVSFVALPDAWRSWIDVLAAGPSTAVTSGSIPVPLIARLPVSVILLVWGARTDRRWVVPVACMLALPVIWYGSLAMLVGVIPLIRPALAERWPALGVGWRTVIGGGWRTVFSGR